MRPSTALVLAGVTLSLHGGVPAGQSDAVKAQEAAAAAPDTAEADAAKKAAMSGGQADEPAARDTAANNPRHGTLTQQEESTAMPKAGQINNHSSTALEKNSGR